jgi:hypothetical protein
MKVSGQLHDLAALSLGKEPPLSIIQEDRWVPEPVLILWRREKPCTA